MEKQEFLNDAKTQSAIVYQLLILGEATKRLSNEFRAAHPQVPWKLISGMRDKLIHAYGSVDLDQVWKTAVSDLPGLIPVFEALVPPMKK